MHQHIINEILGSVKLVEKAICSAWKQYLKNIRVSVMVFGNHKLSKGDFPESRSWKYHNEAVSFFPTARASKYITAERAIRKRESELYRRPESERERERERMLAVGISARSLSRERDSVLSGRGSYSSSLPPPLIGFV